MVQTPEAIATTGTGPIDDYRIVRALGHGGMTFLAHDRFLDRAVVLSLLPAGPDDRAARLAVARAFARASHPNLGRVHRVREGGPTPYVIAAFVRGERLDRLATPLPDARVLAVGCDLAGALAALHALGVAHGSVRAERVIVSEEGAPSLVGLDEARANADVTALRADLRALLALLESIADRALQGRLARLADAERGVVTADELRRVLETLAHPAATSEALPDNPYRGLRKFEREHAALFFGREREIVELVERLRDQPWLLVAGRSGTGKSSLARAGVAPAIVGGALGERETWDVATMVPGAHPIEALARAMAPLVDRAEGALAAGLRKDPALAGRLSRGRRRRGLLLVVDQLEEVITLASAEERDAFCAVLARFNALAPGVRALFTLRGDFLDRIVALGPFGRDLIHAAYVLPTMSLEGLRHAITSPARARGVELETPAMVDALVAEVSHQDEALPLLSFALEELWSARDVARRVIPEEALRRLGGAVAALARHGDLLLATLRDDEKKEARRILLALVADGADTRAPSTKQTLLGPGGAAAGAALEALVRGRLVVAGDTHALVHEALARVWPRLRAWLDEASEARAAAARLAVAASEWVRLGRGAEGLGGARLLRDLTIPGALDGASDDARAFVDASRVAVRRQRLRRSALVAGVAVLLALVGVTGWAALHARHSAAVARALATARALDATAQSSAREADRARDEAFARFDRDEAGPAEALWKKMLALEEDTDRQRRDVGGALDSALALDPHDTAARALQADVTFARLAAAERLHENALRRELRAQLDVYDDGSRAAKLSAPALVRVETDPPGATLTLARYREDAGGRLVESDAAPLAAAAPRLLPPGSYLILASAPDRYPTRYPFLVRRGEDRSLRIVLPPATDVPDGMIYVPAGRTIYGSTDDEGTRIDLLSHQPAHDIEVAAFLIARTEVTNGEYLAFLGALAEPERKARLLHLLVPLPDGRIAWKSPAATLAPGELFCNGVQPCVDWSRLPVDGASRDDGEHYVDWLARSGRLPHARLCADREWERAARGADDRRYPSGNGDLGPDDACTLVRSYCAPGTHPASRSPFGVDDMSGSEWEWTAGSGDVALPAQALIRGGGASTEGIYLSIPNRAIADGGVRYATNGIRVCADAR